jgi:hypothetical protein
VLDRAREGVQRQPQDAPGVQAQPGPQRQGVEASGAGVAASGVAWQPQVQPAPGQAAHRQEAGVAVGCMGVSSHRIEVAERCVRATNSAQPSEPWLERNG